MREWFDRLSVREQRLVLAAGVLVAVAAVQLLIIGPLWGGSARLAAELEERTTLLAELESARAQAETLRAQGQPAAAQGRNESLVVIADRTSRAAGLGGNLRGSQPIGEQRLRVSLEAAAFNSVVPWLVELQQRYAIGIESATLDRGGAPGLVNATLVLERES